MTDTIQQYKDFVITGFVKAVQPVVVSSAEGAVIHDASGKDYLDCFAGISVVNAGHCNPKVIAAAKAQLDKLVHCASYIYHSPGAGEVAGKAGQNHPSAALRKSFFANSGAEAIEGAMKVARLYTGKHEIISLHASFHGRTWGTLSITGNQGRKKRGGPYAPGVAFTNAPYVYRSPWPDDPRRCVDFWAQSLEEVIRFSTAGDVAAFIAEPIMGEGGIIVPPADYFREVKKVLDRHGILFIADEVQSGIGRTGKMFAIEHYGVESDLLVTAKSLGGGLPSAAGPGRAEIMDAPIPGGLGSTFAGNPASCVAALASIETIEKDGLLGRSAAIGRHFEKRAKLWQQKWPIVGQVRGLGGMCAIELVTNRETREPAGAPTKELSKFAYEHGLITITAGTYGNVVRILVPLVVTDEQFAEALDVLEAGLAHVSEARQAALSHA